MQDEHFGGAEILSKIRCSSALGGDKNSSPLTIWIRQVEQRPFPPQIEACGDPTHLTGFKNGGSFRNTDLSSTVVFNLNVLPSSIEEEAEVSKNENRKSTSRKTKEIAAFQPYR